ncbi:thioredoxin-like protein [Jimgerdemannia flammicorona]|uniref:Thioredoxin-like protein n=1 Tax=Jimgerdemannia flammicorona TaxID=994334 RepID=A0A433D165_9FUNG|nr:thioredoxin-like protein [Jimgerdemannia flammicorona]
MSKLCRSVFGEDLGRDTWAEDTWSLNRSTLMEFAWLTAKLQVVRTAPSLSNNPWTRTKTQNGVQTDSVKLPFVPDIHVTQISVSFFSSLPWPRNDILRARGIIPPKDEVTEAQIEQMVDEAIAARIAKENSLEEKTLDELDELEDEEDDRVVQEYRMKRMEEMRAMAAKEKFGDLVQINKPDFVREVTEASKECCIVVHLFDNAIPACKLMNAHLTELAQRYKAVKFLKIVGDQCIPNYPDRNLPTLLVYGEGDIKANLVGAQYFGGMKMTVESLRQILMATGAIPMDPTKFVDDRPKQSRSVYSSKATAALSDDDEESDE